MEHQTAGQNSYEVLSLCARAEFAVLLCLSGACVRAFLCVSVPRVVCACVGVLVRARAVSGVRACGMVV